MYPPWYLDPLGIWERVVAMLVVALIGSAAAVGLIALIAWMACKTIGSGERDDGR